jgi:hypothetical protein
MGNQISVNKINFEDMQYAIKHKYLIINTLPLSEQNYLIYGTVDAQTESEILNLYLKESRKHSHIIVYGKNANDDTVLKKYEQLISLGFTNAYVYCGGLFEWALLQDIYGDDEFPMTKKQMDIIKFRPRRKFIQMIEN